VGEASVGESAVGEAAVAEAEAVVAEAAGGQPAASVTARPAVPPVVEEPEPLDLLSIAGGSIYKRVVPLVVGVVVVGAVIAWLVARR